MQLCNFTKFYFLLCPIIPSSTNNQEGFDFLLVKEVFGDLVKGFATNHSKLFFSLLSSEAKTARAIARETGLGRDKVYKGLQWLVEREMVEETNTTPRMYSIREPMKTLERLVERKRSELSGKKALLCEAIARKSRNERRFLLKIGAGSQTKLIDVSSQKEVLQDKEIGEIERAVRLLRARVE